MKRVYLTIGLIAVFVIAVFLIVFSLGKTKKSFVKSDETAELVYVKGSKTADLIKPSLWAIGGLEGLGIKGKKVLIKPSIIESDTNKRGLNTNPILIGRIIRECYDAGASEVYVTDHASGDWTKCYKNSGIEKASKLAFGKIIPAHEKRYYSFTEFSDDKVGLHIHRLLEKCDIIINIPTLTKSNDGKVRSGLYNLSGLTWENRKSFENSRDEVWIEYFKKYKPCLTIIDATNAESTAFKGIIVSKDPLLAEAASYALISDKEIDDTLMGKLEEQGLGGTNVEGVNIQFVDIQ